MAVYGTQGDVDANPDANVVLYVPGVTKLTANDTFLGGTATGVTDEMLGGAKRIAGYTAQDTAKLYNESLKFNPQQAMAGMQDSLKASSEGYYANQKAMIDSALSTNLAQLQKTYEQAIADGMISIRDAQTAFTEQKAALEKQAYQDSEITALYSNAMGIQNSQQAIGLMQGDQARMANLSNKNMSERDMKIANIKDRINSLGNIAKISAVDAQAQHDYGLAGARGQADLNYSNGLFGLQQADYIANQNQAFTEKNLATQQGYNLENMEKQQMYDLSKLSQQQINQLEILAKQHGYDLEKMAKQYGYEASLAAVARASGGGGSSESMTEQQKYDLQMQRILASGKEGTSEYEVNKLQKNQAREEAVSDILADAEAKQVLDAMNNPLRTQTLIEPKIGIFNRIFGTSKDETYQKQLEEQQRLQAITRKYGIE